MNKDVLNIIMQHASTLDYETCRNVRLTMKRFGNSPQIKEHLLRWCLIEAFDRIEEINSELLRPRPKFTIPFIENYSNAEVILLICDDEESHYIPLKSDCVTFEINGFDDCKNMILDIKISEKLGRIKTYENLTKSIFSIVVPKNKKIQVCHFYSSNFTQIFIPSLDTEIRGWDR